MSPCALCTAPLTVLPFPRCSCTKPLPGSWPGPAPHVPTSCWTAACGGEECREAKQVGHRVGHCSPAAAPQECLAAGHRTLLPVLGWVKSPICMAQHPGEAWWLPAVGPLEADTCFPSWQLGSQRATPRRGRMPKLCCWPAATSRPASCRAQGNAWACWQRLPAAWRSWATNGLCTTASR